METIRKALDADLAGIRAILEECGLPTDDFTDGEVSFLLAEDGGRAVGTIGLETYPPAGLLRSAAVLPSHRNRGLGERLVAALLVEARARSLTELVLLTTTAAPFFGKLGFERIDRGAVPAAALASRQFGAARCSSAAVMRLRLG